MSEIKNGGLDEYGAERFEQQQFVTAGVEGVNMVHFSLMFLICLFRSVTFSRLTFPSLRLCFCTQQLVAGGQDNRH